MKGGMCFEERQVKTSALSRSVLQSRSNVFFLAPYQTHRSQLNGRHSRLEKNTQTHPIEKSSATIEVFWWYPHFCAARISVSNRWGFRSPLLCNANLGDHFFTIFISIFLLIFRNHGPKNLWANMLIVIQSKRHVSKFIGIRKM